MRCAAIRDTLHREAVALDEAQRLVLDDHLADCAGCRRDRDQLLAVHRIGSALEPKVDARAHQRAIARALLEGPRTTMPALPDRRRWLPIAAFAAAAVVIALVVAWRLREPSDGTLTALAPVSEAPAPVPQQAPVAIDAAGPEEIVVEVDDVIEEGSLSAGSSAVATGAQVPARTLLRATARARVRLASAKVVIAASSELRWQPVERTVLLERGRLDIASGPNGIARVVAGRTEVDLGDADATVEAGAVRVTRGTVQVRHGARTLRVTAGTSWALEPAASADELLAEARKKFAARDYAGAERAASAAVATRPPTPVAASARTLLADIALAANQLDRAVERYLAVANDYAGTPVAESALYAAARSELRRSRTAAARALLARYLERYPSGRYVDDVRRQLAALQPAE